MACARVSGVPGSTSNFAQARRYARLIRERALNLPDALPRLLDSLRDAPSLRRRACRNLLQSAVLNAAAGDPLTALRRLATGTRVASWHVLTPRFWK